MYCYWCDAEQRSARRDRQRKPRARDAASSSQLEHQPLGFTLIELLIAVAIVAILAAIAYPSYTSSIRKSHRVSAKTALLDLASREERFFSTNNYYSGNPSDLGYSGSWPVSIPNSSQNYYSLWVTTPAPNTTGSAVFTLQAVPAGDQQNDTTCYTYQIDNAGAQKNLDASSNSLSSSQCW